MTRVEREALVEILGISDDVQFSDADIIEMISDMRSSEPDPDNDLPEVEEDDPQLAIEQAWAIMKDMGLRMRDNMRDTEMEEGAGGAKVIWIPVLNDMTINDIVSAKVHDDKIVAVDRNGKKHHLPFAD
ncbi:MAG: hypothetical protein OEQ39_18955 [Gammaproteobacteria bacterium]|nr:hypothetical protein [Gammaproteobacteria bacterium]